MNARYLRILAATPLAALAFSTPAIAADPIPCGPGTCPPPPSGPAGPDCYAVELQWANVVRELKHDAADQAREVDRMQRRLDRKNETIAELREELAELR